MSSEIEEVTDDLNNGSSRIKNEFFGRIFEFRNILVMMDRDLPFLYGVNTGALNQAVKRNKERFPEDFCFQLNEEEFIKWRSQNVISNSDRMGLRRPPYVFSEQGIAMLSSVLRSKKAIEVNIGIMRAFVEMRKLTTINAGIFQRLNNLEERQITTERKMEEVLSIIEIEDIKPRQGIFFEGQIFDAYSFISELIRSANRSIIIIDTYIDDSVLTLLSKKKTGVKIILLTRRVPNYFTLDIKKFNEQYPEVIIKKFDFSHDRFIIIDDTEVYHFGASLKDLGKKWFAFSKMEMDSFQLLSRVNELLNDKQTDS